MEPTEEGWKRGKKGIIEVNHPIGLIDTDNDHRMARHFTLLMRPCQGLYTYNNNGQAHFNVWLED